MIRDRPEVLQAMLRDMESAPALYRPTNYWNNYQRESYRYIDSWGIGEFRSSKNALWSSFGAVADPLSGHVRPVLAETLKIRRSLPVRALLKIGRKLPVLRQLLAPMDAAWMWERLVAEYEKQLYMLLELSYHYCRSVEGGQLIEQVEDSGLGAPKIVMSINGKKYTIHFLRYFLQYLYLAKFVDFNTVHGIVEIGGGYGGLAEIILKLNPHMVYVNVDIPPQTYIAQQYLDACFPGQVFGYTEAQKTIADTGKLCPQDYPGRRIFTLCPWQLPSLEGEFDLFMNSASFQEMEPEVVENYAIHLKRLVRRYGYIRAVPEGIPTAPKPGAAGTLEKVTKDHYIRYLDTFDLVDESPVALLPHLPGTSNEYRDMFFVTRTSNAG